MYLRTYTLRKTRRMGRKKKTQHNEHSVLTMLLFLVRWGKDSSVTRQCDHSFSRIITTLCVKFCYLFAFVYSPSPPFPLSKFSVKSYGGNGRIIFPQPAQSQMEQLAFFAKIKEEKSFIPFWAKRGAAASQYFTKFHTVIKNTAFLNLRIGFSFESDRMSHWPTLSLPLIHPCELATSGRSLIHSFSGRDVLVII